MKYLKLFENHTDSLYQEISKDEYTKNYDGDNIPQHTDHKEFHKKNNWEAFSSHEIEEIMSFFPSDKFYYHINGNDPVTGHSGAMNNRAYPMGPGYPKARLDIIDKTISQKIISRTLCEFKNVKMNITKLADEWFFVRTIDDTESGDVEYSYFKCDQFDGLIEFLTDFH